MGLDRVLSPNEARDREVAFDVWLTTNFDRIGAVRIAPTWEELVYFVAGAAAPPVIGAEDQWDTLSEQTLCAVRNYGCCSAQRHPLVTFRLLDSASLRLQ